MAGSPGVRGGEGRTDEEGKDGVLISAIKPQPKLSVAAEEIDVRMCEGEVKVLRPLKLTKSGFGGTIEEIRVSFGGKQAFSQKLVDGRWGGDEIYGVVGGGGAGVNLSFR